MQRLKNLLKKLVVFINKIMAKRLNKKKAIVEIEKLIKEYVTDGKLNYIDLTYEILKKCGMSTNNEESRQIIVDLINKANRIKKGE